MLEKVTTFDINDQEIKILTELNDEFTNISYSLESKTPIEPHVVALTLYLIVKELCENQNMGIDDLEDGLSESTPH